ncbi:MAG: NUDIX domain-containing protein [Candidatus Hydrothermarchaeales archaeon]
MTPFRMGNRSKTPAITVDAVVESGGKVLLIKRRNDPFKDHWALPGGFIEYGESAEDAIKREVLEEANLEIEITGLLGVYSNPDRDPRGHVISICFEAQGSGGERGGDDAMDARFFELKDALKEDLAFDHRRILEDYSRSRNVL